MSTTKSAATPSTAEPASASSAAPAAAAPFGLAQQLGNQGLQTLLLARLMQAKLTVSHPQDSYEQEADRVADQVMRMATTTPSSAPVGTIQRLPDDTRELRRFTDATADVPTVDAATEQSIQSLSGRGSALPHSVRSFMEPRFGADFSAVRVHADPPAQALARSVNAQAFTVGRNVVFGAGHYAPDTESGKRLLAHELTHVVQQSSAPRLDRKPETADAITPASGARFKDPFKTGPTIEDWANGSIDISALQAHQLQPAIDELQQWVERQNGSSVTLDRIEATLAALYRELRKRYKGTRLPARDRDARGARGKKPKRPELSPRVLTEKNVTVGYANQADASAEFDLIMRWLTIPDLSKQERTTLLKERANLEWILGIDRQRAASERYEARVRTALTSTDKDPQAALMSVIRTIEGITRDPDHAEISYIYHQGERLAISTEQAAQLRKNIAAQLTNAVRDELYGIATHAYNEYTYLRRINKDARFVAAVADLVQGGISDPGDRLFTNWHSIQFYSALMQDDLADDRLSQAAEALPRIEALVRTMAQDSEAFKESYINGAGRAVTVLQITAKVAASIELAILTAGTASWVSGLVGVEGLGLTGAAAFGATTLGTGAGVGLVTAGARGSLSFGVSLATGHSLGQALDASKDEAFSGLLDGFIAGATGGAARVLAPALGVGKNVAFQRLRQAGAEAIVNGTSSIVQAIKDGKSPGVALEAGLRGAILAIPGGLIGSGTTKKLIYGSLAAYSTAFAGAYLEGASTEDAIQAASIALITHLSASKLGHETDAALVKHGAGAGKVIKNTGAGAGKVIKNTAKAAKTTAVKTTAAIAIAIAKTPPHLSFERPRIALHDDTAVSARPHEEERTPTPDPVLSEEPGAGDTSPGLTGRGGTASGNTELPTPLAPAESPARLFQLLETGINRRGSRASVAGDVVNPPPPPAGVFRGGLTTAEAAYHAYDDALTVSAGREVAIFHHPDTGEFVVMMGNDQSVWSPPGPRWNALVHFHHVATGKLKYRLPAPVDFFGMQLRAIRGETGHLREFVEFDIPGVGRGRTEFGINPANAAEPVYVTIHWADRPPETLTFANDSEYRRHWEALTAYTERGSAEHQAMVRDQNTYMRDRFGFVRPVDPNSRTMAGDPGGPPTKPPSISPTPNQRETKGEIKVPVASQPPKRGTTVPARDEPNVVADPAMLKRARSSIREELLKLLHDDKKVVGTITVERVKFDGVKIKLVDGVLEISIFYVTKDPSAPRGHGKAIMQEFVQAAIDLGRELKARGVRGAGLAVANTVLAADLRDQFSFSPLGGDEKTKGGRTSQAGDGRKLEGDEKTKKEKPPNLAREVVLSGSSGLRSVPTRSGAFSSKVGPSASSKPPSKAQPATVPKSRALDTDKPDGSNGRTIFGRWRKGGRGAKPAPPASQNAWVAPSFHDGPLAPARLYELFQRGTDHSAPHASTAAEGQPSHPGGDYRTGIATPHEAYAAFNEAVAVSAGREVAIVWNRWTGEYRVIIGSETAVPFAAEWVAIVHIHPNPFQARALRLPAPADFNGLKERSQFEGDVAREFVAFDLPSDTGRGRAFIEYGYDPSNAKPFYVRVHESDGTIWERPFADLSEYQRFHGERGTFLENESPVHTAAIQDIAGLNQQVRQHTAEWTAAVFGTTPSSTTRIDLGLFGGASGPLAGQPGSLPVVEVADVGEAFAAALRNGAEAVQAPVPVADGVTVAVIRVPGGTTIGILGSGGGTASTSAQPGAANAHELSQISSGHAAQTNRVIDTEKSSGVPEHVEPELTDPRGIQGPIIKPRTRRPSRAKPSGTPGSRVGSGERDVPDTAPAPPRGTTVKDGPKVEVADVDMLDQAQRDIRQKVVDLLRTGKIGVITAGEVRFGLVRVSVNEDGVLTVSYTTIHNETIDPATKVAKIPGRGLLVHGELEQAARDLGREVQARSVRLEVYAVQNPRLAQELRTLGYERIGGTDESENLGRDLTLPASNSSD